MVHSTLVVETDVKLSYTYNTRHNLSESEVFNRWATASFFGKKMLKSYVWWLVFDKKQVGEIVCGMKVKTFFKDQYFLGTKIKKIRDRLKVKTFLSSPIIWKRFREIGCGMKVKTIHIGPQQLPFKFFGARC